MCINTALSLYLLYSVHTVEIYTIEEISIYATTSLFVTLITASSDIRDLYYCISNELLVFYRYKLDFCQLEYFCYAVTTL